MKPFICCLITSALVLTSCGDTRQNAATGYPITPVPFTSVQVTPSSFWGQRLQASRDVTIPLAFSKCEETGRYENFIRAAHPCDTFTVGGFPFDDTDVYKTIEGASYLLQAYPNPAMEAYIDSVLAIVQTAQEADGYLYTARTQNPAHPHKWSGKARWDGVETGSHEFYNLGHMIEGAIAHYQATGKRNFLDIAIRYADCVCREIGYGEGQQVRVPGHQIAEMALAKLYLVTGDEKYLQQAKFFLDARGTTNRRDPYDQTHRPVTEQDEAVGHAVRATYMYAGMADVAALTGDSTYIRAIDRIWDNIVTRKLYVTGGIGARHAGEAFGDNYELPNETAYNETCAAIGNVYVNYRLFLLHGDAKYFDVLERTLYNGLLAGVSIDGGRFFYPNPLACTTGYERQPWFGCACCPSNICRFIPSVPGYVYAVDDKDVYVNLFMDNEAQLTVAGKAVNLKQETQYPWEGNVTISVTNNRAGVFTLKVRIPEWAQNQPLPSDLYTYSDGLTAGFGVKVNGDAMQADLANGYFAITRKWQAGDKVEVHFDMPVRTVRAHEKVLDDAGLLAVERGPLVYCAEWPDNSMEVTEVKISARQQFEVTDCPDVLHGIRTLCTETPQGRLTLIPYYGWAHRGTGHMTVWLKEE